MAQRDWIKWLAMFATVVTSIFAMAATDRGWAFYEKNIDDNWGPVLHIKLEFGWWNATARTAVSMIPVAIEVESKACRSLGAIAAVFLFCSVLLSLYLASLAFAEGLEFQMPQTLNLTTKRKLQTTGICAISVLVSCVVLYLTLLFGTHKKMKDELGFQGEGVWPLPYWALFCALTAGSSMAAMAYEYKQDLLAAEVADQQGYLPI